MLAPIMCRRVPFRGDAGVLPPPLLGVFGDGSVYTGVSFFCEVLGWVVPLRPLLRTISVTLPDASLGITFAMDTRVGVSVILVWPVLKKENGIIPLSAGGCTLYAFFGSLRA